MNICMYRITILFCYMLLGYLPVFANRGSCSLLCFVDGGGSCIH